VSDKKHSANSALPSLWLPCGVCRGRHSANTRNPVVVSSDRLTFNGATSLRMKRSGRPTRIQRGNGDGSHHQLALLPRGSRTRLAGYSSCVARLASLAPPDAGPRPNRRIRVLTFYREQELLAAHLVFLARERLGSGVPGQRAVHGGDRTGRPRTDCWNSSKKPRARLNQHI